MASRSSLGHADNRPRFYMRLSTGELPIVWRRSPTGPEEPARTVGEAFLAAGIGRGEAVIIWEGTTNG